MMGAAEVGLAELGAVVGSAVKTGGPSLKSEGDKHNAEMVSGCWHCLKSALLQMAPGSQH